MDKILFISGDGVSNHKNNWNIFYTYFDGLNNKDQNRFHICKNYFISKAIKSIVKIRFVEKEPLATWSFVNPREYGFYSNVNPQVDHPRWSQKRERLITGEGGFAALFSKKIDTLMFNGYAEEVADLYKGLDLYKHF